MSANITQFNQQEFAEKLMANMGGGGISRRKWVILGTQVKSMFKRSPCLTYLYGALDTTPPPPKKRKVNFSLTLDIKQETVSDDACVPQGHEVSDVESYYSDLPILPTTPHGGPQVPPLTPGTNLKVGEALRATYSSWNDKTRQLGIPRDPRLWENIEVIAWLDWAANEFQLYSESVTNFIRSFQVNSYLRIKFK